MGLRTAQQGISEGMMVQNLPKANMAQWQPHANNRKTLLHPVDENMQACYSFLATSLTWKRLSRGCSRPLEPSAAASRRFTTWA